MFGKKIQRILCVLSILVLVVSCTTTSAGTGSYFGFFNNKEINRLIDENYELVVQNGWAELRIPESVHGIKRDRFSPNALDVADKLIANGYEAYIIGGSIRDLVIGTPSMDFDITTNATNEQIKATFENVAFHEIPSGHAFAFVQYPGEVIDVASCVNIPDQFYGLPGVPEFTPGALYSGNFVFDSFQRDLTINAIYYDVRTGDLVDYHGGLHDIRDGIIQTTVDPEKALEADSRISVRALRFKSRYGFRFSDRMDEVMQKRGGFFVVAAGASSNSFNIPKFFNAGYALRCYETMCDYNVFDVIYSPIAGIFKTEAYQNYITAAFKWMDEQYAAGNKLSSGLSTAVILWPAVNNKAARAVLQQQNRTLAIDEETMDDYLNLFAIEKKMTQKLSYDEALKLAIQNEFEEAFQLLIIRSLTEKGLEEAVSFWTSIQEIVTYGTLNQAA